MRNNPAFGPAGVLCGTGRPVPPVPEFFPDTPYMGKYTAKLRYRMKDENCLIERLPENKANLLFDNFQFAPAAGQTAAIYDGDIIIGSGVIDYTF